MFKKVLKVFLPLLTIDIIFSIIAFGICDVITYIRYILFDLGISFILCFLISPFSLKTRNIILFVFILIMSMFAVAELQFKNFLDTFYSFSAVSEGFAAVTNFAVSFIKTIKAEYYLVFIAVILYLLMMRIDETQELAGYIGGLCISFMSLALVFTSFSFANDGLRNTFEKHNDFDLLMEKMGPNCFFFNDLYCLTKKNEEESFSIEVIEPVEEEIIEEQPELIVEEVSFKREFDDSKWIETMNAETDSTMKAIDAYLMSRPIEEKNEHTGQYENCNFIYFMVESFDYIAIDPVLTPTLYKLYSEGTSFSNHYTPVYGCGTGDSEYTGMSGTYPLVSECTLYHTEIDNHQSLIGLFKNAGYDVLSFHNWTDEFYPRTQIHPNYGVDAYYDYNGLGITPLNGWLSDLELVEKSLPYFIDSDRFMAFIVTSGMHFPYDCSSTLGDAYLSSIQEVHPDYPITIQRYLSKVMNLDSALKYLIEELDKAGKLENTVIALYGDHCPRTFTTEQIIACSKLMDRSGSPNLYKMPFIIWNSESEAEVNTNVCANLDQLPTLANLFNLNYDPRLYAGNDANNGNCTVKFANGDWISNEGYYRVGTATFTPSGNEVSEDYINRINTEISNIKKTNQTMLKLNYYSKRRFVIDPVNK